MIDFKKELNEEQYKVVTNGDGYVLVLAGAGSGKTRVVTYRVAYVLEHGADPSEILLLTFTNKAAREMTGRVEQLMGHAVKGLWSGTFHSIGSRILREEAHLLGFQKNFTIIDQDDAEVLLKTCMEAEGLDAKNKKNPAASTLHELISFSRNAGTDLSEVIELKYARFAPIAETLDQAALRYQREKKHANVMDFDDLLVYWLEALEHADAGAKWAQRFKYALVDEFQDTNTLQAKIVRRLSDVHHNLLAVGDDAQSIYSFRAADINNILDFNKTFPDARVYKLIANYRSSPEIVRLANMVIAQNKRQFKKELTSANASHVRPELVPHSSPFDEARFIIQAIGNAHTNGTRYADIAVLFRSAFSAKLLEMELVRAGISYEFRGGMRFFDRAHIKDVLSFLRVAENPHDALAWWRILPLQQGIGHETAKRIIDHVGRYPDISALKEAAFANDLSGRARAGWQNALSIFETMKKKGARPHELIQGIAESAYADYIKEKFENPEDRLEDIMQMAAFAERAKSLREFLDSATLNDEYGSNRAEDRARDRLILSTIHQAKGLEWDTVFVINLVEGSFPHNRALNESGGEEEERRLFYVAVTRARRELFLTYALTDARDPSLINRPSPFVRNIGAALVKSAYGGALYLETGDDLPTIVRDEELALHPASARAKKRTGFLKDIDDL